MLAAGRDDAEREVGEAAVRAQIAFYGSTPAYRPVLDCEGLGELGAELNRLSKRGLWAEMAGCVPDALVEAVALRGTPAQAAARARERYGALADRLLLVAPTPQGAGAARAVRDALAGCHAQRAAPT
jgi:alkanesulfonate monooxygenase SsuD/methylene tetrahydromethanopterin reductase-like flavin-dependent oxidoreductase (luciferase family)